LHIFVLRYQYLLFYTPTFLSLLYALSLHDALPISSVCFRPLIPYTSVSSAGGSYRGTRLGPGTESGTSLCSPQDLLHPCATPFACLGRGPPVHKRNKSDENEQAQNVKTVNNFHQSTTDPYS